jgi:hypothetical protein
MMHGVAGSGDAGQFGAQAGSAGFQFAPLGGEGLCDVAHQVDEARQAMTRSLREIGTAEERQPVRRQEHRQRPAAGTPLQQLVSGLVDVVKIRALLAVNLDVHEVAVHRSGDLVVLETLVSHDVTPVARGIADRQQDRLVLRAGQRQCLFAPGPPVHRVVCVLQEIGRSLVGESVGHG